MINYNEKIKELRFNFRPEEPIDYQTLFSLIGSLLVNKTDYEANKEEVFHTVQILTLVYGLEDQITESNYRFDPNNIDINDLNLWKYLLVALYEDLTSSPTNNFNISNNMENLIINILNILNNNLTGSNLDIFKEQKDNEIPTDNTHQLGPNYDKGPYEFVEPNPDFSFVNKNFEDDNRCDDHFENNCDNNFMNNHDDNLNDLNWNYLRDYVITYNLLPYRCDNCGLSEWQGKILPLKLSRKEAYLPNQNLDNIKFLCPNCYSQIGKE